MTNQPATKPVNFHLLEDDGFCTECGDYHGERPRRKAGKRTRNSTPKVSQWVDPETQDVPEPLWWLFGGF